MATKVRLRRRKPPTDEEREVKVMKTMKIIYGSYIEIDGKTFYCKGYNVVEMKQMLRPYNYREMITRIAEITGDKFDNIFVEWINGESLKNPIGFEK